MPGGPVADLDSARQQLSLTATQVWLGYFAMGGDASLVDVRDRLAGDLPVSPRERNIMAQALNDVFAERGMDHPIGYVDE
jgi:hypothetical protein